MHDTFVSLWQTFIILLVVQCPWYLLPCSVGVWQTELELHCCVKEEDWQINIWRNCQVRSGKFQLLLCNMHSGYVSLNCQLSSCPNHCNLSPSSDQHQFSPNKTNTVSTEKVMSKIKKVITKREYTLIANQILMTNSVGKYMEISVENLCVDIGGLKGLLKLSEWG